jgi:hypothetical protein
METSASFEARYAPSSYPTFDPTRLDQELLLRNEYLAVENRIPRGQLKGAPGDLALRAVLIPGS